MAQWVVTVHNLVKTIRRMRVLDGVDLYVERGEVVGLLGLDGAGKTTILRVLAGLVKPDRCSGPVRILGSDPWLAHPDLFRRIAYVPTNVALWTNLSGGQALDLIGRLRGGLDPARRAELEQAFELATDQRISYLTKAGCLKIGLIAAFASDAEVLLLDEPNSTLDPVGQACLMETIQRARGDGRAIIVTSRSLDEVNLICDTVSILHAGRVVESGDMLSLSHLARVAIRLQVASDPHRLATLPGVHEFACQGNTASFTADSSQIGSLMREAVGLGLQALICNPPSLQDYLHRHLASITGSDKTRR